MWTPRNSGIGIVANPASARDIRRLVAAGSVVTTHTKVNMLGRLLSGAGSVGVGWALSMTDLGGISAALENLAGRSAGSDSNWPTVRFVDQAVTQTAADTEGAVDAMLAAGVGAIVVLGGDGTNRIVAGRCGDTPILSLSTGTNNSFPVTTEPTLAGIAAGLVATGVVPVASATARTKTLVVRHRGRVERAVVDVAVIRAESVASGAVWDPSTIDELFLSFAESTSIGMSSIGAALRPVPRHDPFGLRIELGQPAQCVVNAPIAPGLIEPVAVQAVEVLDVDARPVRLASGVIAIDGERIFRFATDTRPTVEIDSHGPLVIDTERTLTYATAHGLRQPVRCTGRPGDPADDLTRRADPHSSNTNTENPEGTTS